MSAKKFEFGPGMDTEGLKNLSSAIKSTMDQMNSAIETNLKQPILELQKIQTPLKKKDLKIDGKNCFMSLIEDGRVMVYFPDQASAESYFNDNTNKSWWQKLFKWRSR